MRWELPSHTYIYEYEGDESEPLQDDTDIKSSPTDAVVIINDRRFDVHQKILSKNCDFFTAAFRGYSLVCLIFHTPLLAESGKMLDANIIKESKTGQVTLYDLDETLVEFFVVFQYHGWTKACQEVLNVDKIDFTTAIEIFKLADYFCCDGLLDEVHDAAADIMHDLTHYAVQRKPYEWTLMDTTSSEDEAATNEIRDWLMAGTMLEDGLGMQTLMLDFMICFMKHFVMIRFIRNHCIREYRELCTKHHRVESELFLL